MVAFRRGLARVLNVPRPSAGNYIISAYTRKLTQEKNTMYAVTVEKPCVRSQYSEYIQEFTLEPYICSDCGKALASKSQLRGHQ